MPPPPTPTKKPVSKAKASRPPRPKPSKPAPTTAAVEEAPSTPSQVPLPPSRSPSPESLPYPMPSGLPRIYRSPKRTFDESSASSEGSQGGVSKRPRSATRKPYVDTVEVTADGHDFEDIDTPDLTVSNPGSPSSMSSLSSVPSPAASPPPPEPEPQPSPEPPRLTRRERKRLGLPRTRNVRASAGKIIIPGGRFKGRQPASTNTSSEGSEEWQKNGTGRVDVRGFRELKI